MKNIIIAGSTGYLGLYIVKALKDRNASFKAITRNKSKLRQLALSPSEIIEAEVTQPDTLKGKLDGSDVVISTVGITRQKDGLTYMDVDYLANMNLLNEALKAGAKKFIYISVLNGEKMKHLKIVEAKEKFVDALKASGIDYSVIRPNGFFSDMRDFLNMAKSGKVYLFGDGQYKLNPIHGQDLAKVILDLISASEQEVPVGGPDIFTQKEIASMALRLYEKPVKISYLPDWVRKASIKGMRLFTSSKKYGPYEFFLSMMGQDNIAPRYGVQRLANFFREEIDKIDG